MPKLGLTSGVFTSVRDAIIAGAGAVLSAASDQTWLQVLGIVAIFLGLGHMVWGLTIDERPWWERPSLKGREAGWMPLHKALRYIALKSDWAFSIREVDLKVLDALLEREVMECLARGDIDARGIEFEANRASSATTKLIDKEFWETAFIQPFGEIVIAEDARGFAARDGKYQHAPAVSYRGIVLNMSQVKERWPKGCSLKNIEVPTVFHPALIAYFKHDGEGDQRLIRELQRVVTSHDEFRE